MSVADILERKHVEEWSGSKRWNPFNSYKLLAHVYRWRLIERGKPVPQPVLVTVDPVNACNLSCPWCNAKYILDRRNRAMDKSALMELAEGLSRWQGSPEWPGGVESVCIAGGGEPLLHPHIGDFIEACRSRNIEVGVVTNGTRIHEHVKALSMCTWVGVSVDAGSEDLYRRLKGKNRFARVTENIRLLNETVKQSGCQLGMERPGYGVTYKYLLWNGNARDILAAARKAKELGCRNFHLRPGGVSWDRLDGENGRLFGPEVRDEFARQISEARGLEDETFGVYGITHKFDSLLDRANRFHKCHAVFMTAVFMPPGEAGRGNFSVGLCCDRRGDHRVEFNEGFTDFAQVERIWGSEAHWAIFDSLNLKECPRCTYQPHNQIFEHVIQADSMTYRFI